MSDGVEIWRGSVAAWECDSMGHLNVRFYVARSMEGLVGLAAELGMPRAFAPDAGATLIVQEQHIRFLREAHPNAALSMTGGVLEMGESDGRLLMLLRHRDGQIAASVQTVVSHVTAHDGRPFPWPARIRDRAAALAVVVPEGAGPRSIALDPISSEASLARAETLGLTRTALGAVGAGDCDAFGRMRTELMMGRISDGVPHIFSDQRPGAEDTPGRRVGGAAVEYRLVHLDWPRAGDRVELRSGSAGGDARIRKLVHWLLDPTTGRPWGVAEATAVSFDLDTRKLIVLSDEALAAANAKAIPGLAL